jgi:hypothetical protein
VEDVLLFEAPRRDTALAVELLARVASSDGGPIQWEGLTITDLETCLLELRRLLFGDVIRAEAVCPAAACGAKIDVSFRVSEYVAHHSPREVRDANARQTDGWYSLSASEVAFRLPLAGDRIAVAAAAHPDRALSARCLRPAELPPRILGRVVRVMQTMAPAMADVVQGRCPECDATVEMWFDPQEFTLRELHDEAAHIFDEVHLLASRYHWSEEEILAMSGRRRLRYVELIRQQAEERA